MRFTAAIFFCFFFCFLSACQEGPALTAPPPFTASFTPSASRQTPVPTSGTPTKAITPALASASATPIPTSAASPALVCLSRGGQVELGEVISTRLEDPLKYRAWLPPCYAQHPERRYPVLYLLHGMDATDEQWERLGAGETAARLIAAGEISPFIIVMPLDPDWEQPTQVNFGLALVDDLIPHIDARYRTHAERLQRAIGGLSRGGAWAIHLGLSHWEAFSAFGGHSPSIFWSDAVKIPLWLDAIPSAQLPAIYLDIGDHDTPELLEAATGFEALLTEKNIPHEWHLFSGYHEEAYWSKHLEDYLRWYASAWGP